MNRPTRDQAARQARRDRNPRRPTWPFPTDRTALDRARRLAQAALAVAETTNPTAAAQIREHARMYGETWLTSTPDRVAGTRRLTADEAAAIVGRRPKTIYSWTNRGVVWAGARHHLTRHPDGYDEAELLAFDAAMRGNHPNTPSPERHPNP